MTLNPGQARSPSQGHIRAQGCSFGAGCPSPSRPHQGRGVHPLPCCKPWGFYVHSGFPPRFISELPFENTFCFFPPAPAKLPLDKGGD